LNFIKIQICNPHFTHLPGNDLDSIRALFSEKEKELTLAVAKVEALTRQLEELRRDRRGLSLIANNGNNQQPPSQAARELEKLRRELMVRRKRSQIAKSTKCSKHKKALKVKQPFYPKLREFH
jgi:apoptosis-stimulating of p53 protein 1